MIENRNFLSSEGKEDKLAIGSSNDNVCAVKCNVDCVYGTWLISSRVVCANSLTVVRPDQANLTILGARQKEVTVRIKLDQGERTLVKVEKIWLHREKLEKAKMK